MFSDRVTPDWPIRIAAAQADLGRGRPDLALARLQTVATDPAAPSEAVRLCATALRQLGRNAAACPLLERVVCASPTSAVAEHNLAAALGDLGDALGSAKAAQRAIDKGGKAPETWLVLGRALQGLGRLTDAESAYRESLRLRPGQIEARRDLAQLIWMRTADATVAMRPFETTNIPAELHEPLIALGAAAKLDMQDDRASYDWLLPFLGPGSGLRLHLAAARAAGGFDPSLALTHARAAFAAAPEAAEARIAVVTALMGCGLVSDALPMLDAHLQDAPLDQYAIALRYTALRLLHDPRALTPADYETLVRGYSLLTPDPSTDLAPWMVEAGKALDRLHAFQAHPFDQSVRMGTQAPIDPRWARDPVLDAVFAALDTPVSAYVNAMNGQTDPMSRRRTTAGWEMSGAWSIRLRQGGRHTDHIHPRGWVSSALHIVLPTLTPDAPRAGWLRFGAVRLGVGLDLPAEHWVEPRPGRVVLFPSWLWHGTEPFTGSGDRLTIAFDVQPR